MFWLRNKKIKFSLHTLKLKSCNGDENCDNANENGDEDHTDANDHDRNTTRDDNTCNRHDGFYDNMGIEYDLKQNIQKQQN